MIFPTKQSYQYAVKYGICTHLFKVIQISYVKFQCWHYFVVENIIFDTWWEGKNGEKLWFLVFGLKKKKVPFKVKQIPY